MKYNVWITLFGSSAANAGIIGTSQKTRSSWATGSLQYLPVNDGSQQNYQFEARDDSQAYLRLTELFKAANPRERRPLAGKSYISQCRPSLRKAKEVK